MFVLDALFDRVIIPGAVWEELNAKPGAIEPGLVAALKTREFDPTNHPVPPRAAKLHAGERHAIAVAYELRPQFVLIDEREARQVANDLGLDVRGTIGILIEARKRGVIEVLKPHLDRLIASGFHVHPGLIAKALTDVEE